MQLKNSIKKIAQQYLFLLVLYQVIRLLFFCINKTYFPNVSVLDYLKMSIYGIRFDASAICILNVLYVTLILFPIQGAKKTLLCNIASVLFVVVNSFAILFCISDVAYFPYTHKRTTFDVFTLIGEKSDFINLLPSYVTKFWWVTCICVLAISAIIFFNKKIYKKYYSIVDKPSSFLVTCSAWLVCIASSIIVYRGGFQLKPMSVKDAIYITTNQNIPIVSNTPFSIFSSYELKDIKELSYYTDSEVKKIVYPIKKYNSPKNTCNVVVLIVESLGKQYTSIGGRTTCTPFIDSLMQHSMVCANAFANAYRSADGIPSVLASIPGYMNEPFASSLYGTNDIDALGNCLQKINYTTAFFHGGTNGTMSFDLFAKSAGFENYYGRYEYNNDKDYDGTWGIFDEPFLQYTVRKMSTMKQPFCSSIFTLSSHEPFKIPKKYVSKVSKYSLEIEKGICYADFALQHFFEEAKKQPWFSNTLFVITADHNFLANGDSVNYYNQKMGLYAVPILFYKPNSIAPKVITKPTQQIDIMPTILDYVGYKKSFYCLGKSIYDSISPTFIYNEMNPYYQFAVDSILLTLNDEKPNGLYTFPYDSMFANNLVKINTTQLDSVQKIFKAYKQNINNNLIHNKMTFENYTEHDVHK